MAQTEPRPKNEAPIVATEHGPKRADEPGRAEERRPGRRGAGGGRKRKPEGATAGEKRGASAEKRRLILETAIHVFAEKGFHDTRISDIAKRAKIAYGLVYHYFKNKEEILDTIFLERWGEFISAIRSIASEDRDVEGKLHSIALLLLSVQRDDPEWTRILISEIQRSQRMLDRERLAIVAELFEQVAGILRAGQEAGALRADLDPELASTIFIGGLDAVVTSRVLDLFEGESTPADGARFEDLARTVVELFYRGMVGRGEAERRG